MAAILKCGVSVRSGTKIPPSSPGNSPGSSRFTMRRFWGLWGRGWNLSLKVFEFPTTFIIYRLLSSHSPEDYKMLFVLYDCISHFSIFERRTSTRPEVGLFPFLVWNRIQAYWKIREAQFTENCEGYPLPGVIISKNRLPGFSFTPYISVLRQNLS